MGIDFRRFNQWSPPTRRGTIAYPGPTLDLLEPGVSLTKASPAAALKKMAEKAAAKKQAERQKEKSDDKPKFKIVIKDPETGKEHEQGTPGYEAAKKKQKAAAEKPSSKPKETAKKPSRRRSRKKDEPEGWGKPAKAFDRDIPKKKKAEPKKAEPKSKIKKLGEEKPATAPKKRGRPKKIKAEPTPAGRGYSQAEQPSEHEAGKRAQEMKEGASKMRRLGEAKTFREAPPRSGARLEIHPSEAAHIAESRKPSMAGRGYSRAEQPGVLEAFHRRAGMAQEARAKKVKTEKKPETAAPSAGQQLKEKFHSILSDGPKLLGAGRPETPKPHVPGVVSHPTTAAVTGSHAASKPAPPTSTAPTPAPKPVATPSVQMPDEFAARHWDLPKSLEMLKAILASMEKARRPSMGRSTPSRGIGMRALPKPSTPAPARPGRAAPVGGMGRAAPARSTPGAVPPTVTAARPEALGGAGTRERAKVMPAPSKTVVPAPSGAVTLAPMKPGGEAVSKPATPAATGDAVAKPVAGTLEEAGKKGKEGTKEKPTPQMALPGSAAAEGAFLGSALAPTQVVGGGAEIAQVGPMYAGGKLDVASAGVRVPAPVGGAQRQTFGGRPGTTMTPGVPTGQPSMRRQTGQAGVRQSAMKSLVYLGDRISLSRQEQ